MILISYLFISDPSFHTLDGNKGENRFVVLFMSDLIESEEACVDDYFSRQVEKVCGVRPVEV